VSLYERLRTTPSKSLIAGCDPVPAARNALDRFTRVRSGHISATNITLMALSSGRISCCYMVPVKPEHTMKLAMPLLH
jgi:hypothetical protein